MRPRCYLTLPLSLSFLLTNSLCSRLVLFFGAQCLTGIQEMNVWNGACDYDVGHHDLDPASDYYRLSMGALVPPIGRNKAGKSERATAGEIPKTS